MCYIVFIATNLENWMCTKHCIILYVTYSVALTFSVFGWVSMLFLVTDIVQDSRWKMNKNILATYANKRSPSTVDRRPKIHQIYAYRILGKFMLSLFLSFECVSSLYTYLHGRLACVLGPVSCRFLISKCKTNWY